MTKLIRILFLLILPQGLWAQDIPDFSANYLVKINGLQAGELKRTLETNSDGTRLFSSSSQAKGVFAFFKPDLVEEQSLWQKKADHIQTIQYIYQRSGGKKPKFMQLDFNWNNNTLSIDDQKQPWSLELKPNTLDKLVYQLSLMSDLSSDATELTYQIADGGKLKTYRIEILGTETVTTPLGKIEAIKLKRHRDKPKDRQTILWCAPSLGYLPVMLEHTEKGGSVFTAELRKLKGIDTKGLFSPLRPKTSTGFNP